MGACCETDFAEAQLAFNLAGESKPVQKPKSVLKNEFSEQKRMSVQFAPTPKREIIFKYHSMT